MAGIWRAGISATASAISTGRKALDEQLLSQNVGWDHWQRDKKPVIEAYLQQVPEGSRATLLRNLVLAEGVMLYEALTGQFVDDSGLIQSKVMPSFAEPRVLSDVQ